MATADFLKGAFLAYYAGGKPERSVVAGPASPGLPGRPGTPRRGRGRSPGRGPPAYGLQSPMRFADQDWVISMVLPSCLLRLFMLPL